MNFVCSFIFDFVHVFVCSTLWKCCHVVSIVNIIVKVLEQTVVDNIHSMCSDNSFDIKLVGQVFGV